MSGMSVSTKSREGFILYKLLITDLDDTLYSWTGFYIPAFYAMAEEVSRLTGIGMELLLDEYRNVHQEKGSVEYPFATLRLPSVRKFFAGKSDGEMKELLQPAFTEFNRIRSERLRLFPGVWETLRELIEQGVRIIGFTDSGELNGFYRLQLLGISDLFSKVYVSNYEYSLPDYVVRDPRIREAENGKPDPELLLRIIAEEGVDPSEVVCMGDSLTKDVLMAHEAGVTSIQCCYPPDARKHEYELKLIRISSWTEEIFQRETELRKKCEAEQIRPDYVVTDYREIEDIICR